MNTDSDPDPDPFSDLGEKQARKEKRRMASVKAEREERDVETQFRLYTRAKRASLKALLKNDVLGAKVHDLVNLLRKMGPDSAPALVDYIDRALWLKRADIEVRRECLTLISSAIVKFRVQHGLPPFDDSLFNEEPNAFLMIRKMLIGV